MLLNKLEITIIPFVKILRTQLNNAKNKMWFIFSEMEKP